MLVRDAEGRIIIISRKDFKTEQSYFQRLFDVKTTYLNKYKSFVLVAPKNG